MTLAKLTDQAKERDIGAWLRDRKNRRVIPHRLEKYGYAPVRNDLAGDGLWKIKGARAAVYAKKDLPTRDQIAAASGLATPAAERAEKRWSRQSENLSLR